MKTGYTPLLLAGFLSCSILTTSVQAAPCVASTPTPQAGEHRSVLLQQLNLSAQQESDWNALVAAIVALEEQRQQQMDDEVRARQRAAALFASVLDSTQQRVLMAFNTLSCEPGSSTPRAQSANQLLADLNLHVNTRKENKAGRPDQWAYWAAYTNTLEALPGIRQQQLEAQLASRNAVIATFYNRLTPKQQRVFNLLGGLL